MQSRVVGVWVCVYTESCSGRVSMCVQCRVVSVWICVCAESCGRRVGMCVNMRLSVQSRVVRRCIVTLDNRVHKLKQHRKQHQQR